jgi:hypothetical protein
VPFPSHKYLEGSVPAGHDANNSTDWIMQARSRLARRRAEKPATKADQIRALWPDIEAALAVGQSMKTLCAWLAEDAGITLGVTSLTSYVSRIRRREAAGRRELPRPTSATNSNPLVSPFLPIRTVAPHNPKPLTSFGASPVAQFDPLANLHASQAKLPGFNYRPPGGRRERPDLKTMTPTLELPRFEPLLDTKEAAASQHPSQNTAKTCAVGNRSLPSNRRPLALPRFRAGHVAPDRDKLETATRAVTGEKSCLRAHDIRTEVFE